MYLFDHVEHTHNHVVTTSRLSSTENTPNHQWTLRLEQLPLFRVWLKLIVLHILVLEQSRNDILKTFIYLVYLFVQSDGNTVCLRKHFGCDGLVLVSVSLEVRKVISIRKLVLNFLDFVHFFKRLH